MNKEGQFPSLGLAFEECINALVIDPACISRANFASPTIAKHGVHVVVDFGLGLVGLGRAPALIADVTEGGETKHNRYDQKKGDLERRQFPSGRAEGEEQS